MKKFKKIMALAIAMVMVLSMSISVFADETPTTYTVTITKNSTDKAAHTYGAYQIFTGKLETVDGKDVLSDIQWGSGVTGATVITELNKIEGFSIPTSATAADVAKAISDKAYTADSAGAQAVADAINAALTSTTAGTGTIAADATSGTITGLAAGYYLVKDTAAVSGEGAQTRFILEVVKDVAVNEKASVPSVEKKVKEKDDNTGVETGWQDAADYDIGDEIPYQITGTLPSTFADFDKYTTYTFTDTLSAGLTPPATDKVTVKVGDADVTSHFDIAVSGQVLTISLKDGEDLKTWTAPALTSASKFVVDYKATLNDSAKIGSEGNPNTVKLTFSNNPNYDSDGETGTTPEDKVIVFTYEIKALKVEPDGDAIDQSAYDALNDTAKADYVKVGDKWQKTKALAGAGFTLYKKVNGEYAAVGEEITGQTTFTFKGTDAGQYKLVETTVPDGYNKANDVEITVTATYDTDSPDPKLTSLTVSPETAGFVVESTSTTTGEGDDAVTTTTYSGDIVGKILNQKGSVLPSTGCIGTTIFYILGAILVLGAGIVLVTRRRMSAN